MSNFAKNEQKCDLVQFNQDNLQKNDFLLSTFKLGLIVGFPASKGHVNGTNNLYSLYHISGH